jgi:hypothetical protein
MGAPSAAAAAENSHVVLRLWWQRHPAAAAAAAAHLWAALPPFHSEAERQRSIITAHAGSLVGAARAHTLRVQRPLPPQLRGDAVAARRRHAVLRAQQRGGTRHVGRRVHGDGHEGAGLELHRDGDVAGARGQVGAAIPGTCRDHAQLRSHGA